MNTNQSEVNKDTIEQEQPKLKNWDEAIKELGSFIRKTKAEEIKQENNQED